MSRISGCIWLVVGVILALSAGGVAFVTLQRASAQQTEASSTAALVDVVVATHSVAVGSMLSEGDVAVQSWPADKMPASAVRSTGDAKGQITMVTLEVGEPVLKHHITKPDIKGANLGFTLAEGKVGVTLAAEDLFSKIQVLQPGDKVDILYSLKLKKSELTGQTTTAGSAPSTGTTGGTGAKTDSATTGDNEMQFTFGTLQAVEVVSVVRSGVGEQTEKETQVTDLEKTPLGNVYAYVLALQPQDALLLKYLRDADAVMDLAVRNIADETDHKTKAVDANFVVDKFQLQVH
jgi:pilus assembly protein CpaB